MSARAGTAYVDVRGDFSALNRGLRQHASSQARPMRKLGSNLGGALATGIGAGVKAGAVGVGAAVFYSLKKASDFEGQLSSLGSVSDATGKQMRAMSKQALKAGADTKFSALEAAKAQTELSKGGLSLAKIMRGGLKSALALAAAGEMDLAQAAETTVNSMKLFGLRGKDAMKVADGLATAANSTTADVSHFALALKQGGSAAKAAGLDFVETTAFLEALAEMGIKGSDAGTSMKAALTQLASPTEKAANLMADLGIRIFDAEGNMRPLDKVAGNLRGSLGDLTREQRLQAATTLAGTDGMRGLLALYDAGPKKISQFETELHKQGTAARVAKQKQDNLKGSIEQMTGSFETLGIQIGTAAIPEVRHFTDDITSLTNKIGKIVGRDDIGLGEKLNQILKVTEVRAEPWVDKLKAGIERANLPERLGDLLAKAVAIGASKGGPLAAKAFISSFIDTNVWGRLAIGGWLLTKMGGPGAFKRTGAQAGASFGGGMATGVGASGLKGRMAGMFRSWGPALAGAIALTFGPELIKAIDQKARPAAANGLPQTTDALGTGLRAALGKSLDGNLIDWAKLTANAPKAGAEGVLAALGIKHDSEQRLRDFGSTAEATFAKLRKAGDVRGMGRLAEQARALARDFPQAAKALNDFAGRVEAVKRPTQGVQDAIARMDRGASSSIKNLRTNVRLNTKLIKNSLDKDSAEGRAALVENFNAAARNIHRAMDHGKVSVKEGTAEIERLMLKALQGMGFSKKQALAVQGAKKSGTTNAVTGSGELRPHQRGAYISDGKPVGDSVPALLEKGEYVLNRKAVKKAGRATLDRLNFGVAPRFQTGGIVELLHPFNDPAGHGGSNSHLHIAMANIQALIALGRKLQSLGWLVSEQSAFGGVNARHAAGGYHYSDQAIDVNWPDAGQEAAKIRALLPMLGGSLGALAPKLKRMLVNGPDSPLKSLAQGALDLTQGAAQSVLDNAAGGIEGAEVSAGGQFNKSALKRLWVQAGGDPSVANTMAAVALAESGGNPSIVNSIGAGGLWQIHPPEANYLDPLTNARMAVRKYGESGFSPWEAYTNGNYRQFLQSGGLVGMLKGGAIGKTLRKVARAKSPKVRRGAIGGLLKSIKGIDLPKKLKTELSTLAGTANTAGEFADRASQLTVTNDDGSVIEGAVGGKTQVEWLTDQLTALFQWRNRIIDAEKIIVEKREETRALIDKARARLNAIRGEIKAAGDLRGRLAKRVGRITKRIEEAKKHPKRNRTLIASLASQRGVLGAQIAGIDGMQRSRARARDALKDKILPALTGQRASLNTARGDLLSNLETVQGIGSPMERLSTPPAVGVLGGQIFDVQMRLRELTAEKPKVTDTAAPDDGGRADLLAGLLREANQRTAVSEAQFGVLKNFPFGGNFAKGGTVMGPPGAPRSIIAHGGERILTRDEADQAAGPRVRVVVEDRRVRVYVDDVEQIVENYTRKQARAGSRGLAGRPGVIR